MKKLIMFALGAVFSVVSTSAGIIGTDHDFSTKPWGNEKGPCAVCHTPHSAQSLQGAPLWGHATTMQVFKTYASDTLRASPAQPGPTSKMCLSCHDGTLAMDSFGSPTPKGGTDLMTGEKAVGHGGNLTDDHPIGFDFSAALAQLDKGLVTPVSARWVDGANQLPLFAGKMECATCHGVHDNSFGDFLRVSNKKSTLCLTCHIK